MDNAQIARDVFEELFSEGKVALVDQRFDKGYRGHDPLTGELDREGLKQSVQMYRAAFPDLTVNVDDLVAASDKVLVRWTTQGTHRGPFLGKSGTGKKIQVQGITVFNFRRGKVIEAWTHWDALGLFQELGITPEIPELAMQASAR